MKMKEFGPGGAEVGGGGGVRPCRLLDPPMCRGWQMSCSICYIWRFMVLQTFDCPQNCKDSLRTLHNKIAAKYKEIYVSLFKNKIA